MSSEDNRPTHGFNVNQPPPNVDSPSNIRQAQASISAANMSSANSSPASSSGSKPKQRVVETGQEHTGRWTREEHEAFLLALQLYGKEWKKVAAKVKTRTVVQTRTHAQKYFQKLQKGLENEMDGADGVEVGTIAEAKKILPIASARRGQAVASGTPGAYAKKGRKKQDRSLLATAMSAQKRHAAAATQAAAQLMTQISQVNTTNEEQSMLNAAAGPGISLQSYQAQSAGGMFAGTTFAQPMSGDISSDAVAPMTIVAPRPEHTMKKNMFPEPSPAACGKRKVDELAAAQLLAGQMLAGQLMAGVAAIRNVVPSSLSKIARASTPSPEMNLNDGIETVASTGPPAHTGLNLQIINPETLQSNKPTKKRSVGHEPVTPWDGQLEALNR